MSKENADKRRIYPGNLVRVRAMQPSLMLGVFGAMGMFWAGGVGMFIGFALGFGLGIYHYIGIQMVCRACASRLHAVRTQGEVLRCHRCGSPTDKAVDQGLTY